MIASPALGAGLSADASVIKGSCTGRVTLIGAGFLDQSGRTCRRGTDDAAGGAIRENGPVPTTAAPGSAAPRPRPPGRPRRARPPPTSSTLRSPAAVEAVGGATREGQVAMAEAVAHTFDTGDHLLVQAGTGTGKSPGLPRAGRPARGQRPDGRRRRHRHHRPPAPARRARPAAGGRSPRADARPAADLRDPQGPPPLPVRSPAQRGLAQRRRRHPLRAGPEHRPRPGRQAHPHLGGDHRDR